MWVVGTKSAFWTNMFGWCLENFAGNVLSQDGNNGPVMKGGEFPALLWPQLMSQLPACIALITSTVTLKPCCNYLPDQLTITESCAVLIV